MVKKRIPDRLQAWIDARKRHHLTHAQVQMARELGMNPKKLGKLDNHRQERWKAPLPEFIEELYERRFGKLAPDVVMSIEELARIVAKKEAERREEKRATREGPLAAVLSVASLKSTSPAAAPATAGSDADSDACVSDADDPDRWL
jgi:hypothetical protein